jgi:hypothetical protein
VARIAQEKWGEADTRAREVRLHPSCGHAIRKIRWLRALCDVMACPHVRLTYTPRCSPEQLATVEDDYERMRSDALKLRGEYEALHVKVRVEPHADTTHVCRHAYLCA